MLCSFSSYLDVVIADEAAETRTVGRFASGIVGEDNGDIRFLQSAQSVRSSADTGDETTRAVFNGLSDKIFCQFFWILDKLYVPIMARVHIVKNAR